ncbi:hypothetical protein D044_0086A, partial [Vibrio parahaemolyticus EKP-026]
MKFVGLLVYEA